MRFIHTQKKKKKKYYTIGWKKKSNKSFCSNCTVGTQLAPLFVVGSTEIGTGSRSRSMQLTCQPTKIDLI